MRLNYMSPDPVSVPPAMVRWAWWNLKGWWLCMILLLSLAGAPYSAHALEAGLSVTLALSPNAVDGTGSTPVEATITVSHTLSGGGNVLAPAGFSTEPWEFLLVFTNPQGLAITSNESPTSQQGEDLNPTIIRVPDSQGVVTRFHVEGIESLTSSFTRTVIVPDVRTLYNLPPGDYQARVLIPFQRYDAIFDTLNGVPVARIDATAFEGALTSNIANLAILIDTDSDGWTVPDANQAGPAPLAVDCDDSNAAIHPGATEIPGNGVDDDCNAATSDVVAVTPATVTIVVEDKNKAPVVGFPVRLFDRTSVCVQQFGTAPQHFASIWLSSCPGPGDGLTDAVGQIVMLVPPGAYLAIGKHTPPGGGPVQYEGKNVGAVAAGESIAKTIKLK